MLYAFAIATALHVFVCLHRCHAAASVMGHALIFTVLARFLFTLPFRTVSCRAGMGVETMPCWHGTARFEHSSDVFTLVFRSVLCWTEPCWHSFTCQCKCSINVCVCVCVCVYVCMTLASPQATPLSGGQICKDWHVHVQNVTIW